MKKPTEPKATHSKAKNSYILKSNVGPTFKAELSVATSNLIKWFNLNWWDDANLEHHLTIATCKGDLQDSSKEIAKRNAYLAKAVTALLATYFSKSVFLLPHDLEITDGGWVILKFAPLSLEQEKPELVLNTIHEQFVKIGLACNLNFVANHIHNHFMPHISIGRVKYVMPSAPILPMDPNQSKEQRQIQKNTLKNALKQAAILKAVQIARIELNTHKNALMKELHKIRLFNLYRMDLCYNPRATEKENTENQILAELSLPPRNLGVSFVSAEKEGYMLHFTKKEQAETCAQFLLYFGITSHLDHKKPKTVRTLQSTLGLWLLENEYKTIAGVIRYCPTDLSKIKKLGATLEQGHPQRVHSSASKPAAKPKLTREEFEREVAMGRKKAQAKKALAQNKL